MADRTQDHTLDVWLRGVHVAELKEPRSGAVTLRYTDAAHETSAQGAPLLSVSLPRREQIYSPGEARPYLEGLLPEGEARTALEAHFKVRRGDLFGLLRSIGRDCAGAVSFCAPGDDPPAVVEAPRGAPMDDAGLDATLAALPEAPLGSGDDVRISLAGLQAKLVLARDPHTGRWMQPTGGTPSTHIMKPEPDHLAGLVTNEAFCLRIARHLGLTSIDIDHVATGAGPALVVSRYDRRVHADGRVSRLHQEDMAQALRVDLGRFQEAEYQAEGGPGLADVAAVLDRFSAEAVDDLEALLGLTVLNVAIGNADAHAKNMSVLLHPDGRIRLAPAYDLASTVAYTELPGALGPRRVDRRLAMSVNGLFDLDDVGPSDLLDEGASWPGFSRRRAAEAVSRWLDALPPAVDEAAASTPELGGLPELVEGRITRLRR